MLPRPRVICSGLDGVGNKVISPAGVILPIAGLNESVNQTLPSGPSVIDRGEARSPLPNSVIAPFVVIRPILPADSSVNQRLPSAPAVMSSGKEFGVGRGNFASACVVKSARQILFPVTSRDVLPVSWRDLPVS